MGLGVEDEILYTVGISVAESVVLVTEKLPTVEMSVVELITTTKFGQ